MNPTLLDADWVFTNRLALRRKPLQRGEVVTFISPRGKIAHRFQTLYLNFQKVSFLADPTKHVIKRIIALEGDIVKNDKYSFEETLVPKGHCWVEGDNPTASVDSVKYGPIATGLIYAKVSEDFSVFRILSLFLRFAIRKCLLSSNSTF